MLGKSRYHVSHSDSEDSESENELVQSILKKGRSTEKADSPRSEDISFDFLEKGENFDSDMDSDSEGAEDDKPKTKNAAAEESDAESDISDWGVRSVSSGDRTDTGDERSFARSNSEAGSVNNDDPMDNEKFEYVSEGSEGTGTEGGSDALSVRSFERNDLDNQLKRFELDRTDFDIASLMLYVNDLADVMGVAVEDVTYRLSRYINSVFPDNYPMGKDLEASHAAIHSFASLLTDPEKSDLSDRVDYVTKQVAQATGETEEYGLTFAVPLVLNSLESSHSDVRNIVGKSLSRPTDKAELFPIPEDEAVSLREKLDSDESGALKTFKGLRTLHPRSSTLPIGFRVSLDNFENRLRELGSSGLRTVTASIPIEGENLESLVVGEDSEELNKNGSAFVGGEPLALTISEVPYSELTYNHIFVD